VILLVTAAVLLSVAGMVGVAIGAETTPDYGVRTARLNDGERPGSSFDHAVESGTSITDAVEIFNFTATPMTFDVYSADMVSTSNGGLTAASRTVDVAGTGLWIVVSTDPVEVPPHESVLVDFDIVVPEGTPPGDNAAAILVEPHAESTGASIESRTRIGIRINIEVIGQVELGVALGDLASERLGDTIRFRLEVSNTGSTTFEVDGAATVANWSGDELAEILLEPAGVFVAPGEQVVLVADWADPPFFGRVDTVATVRATVGDREPVLFETSVLTLWIIPWALIVIAAAALVLTAWILYRRRDAIKAWRDRRRDERAMLKDYRKHRDHAEP
jgi:hypothetical protein